MDYSAKQWVKNLNLVPHPEGGFYKEIYRSENILKAECLAPTFNSDHPYVTCIYFLLETRGFSALHRIKQDELWHFLDGSGLTIHMINPEGQYQEIKLGKNFTKGEQLQAVVPAGNWFGSSVTEETGFALVGCTVAPGFSFEDFEMPSRDYFLQKFPEHRDVIEKLTR